MKTRWIVWTGLAAFLLITGFAIVKIGLNRWSNQDPYFQDDFGSDSSKSSPRKHWEAFGGTWQVVNGTMQNIADDRGAKLMNGSRKWHNYMIEADVQLLGETGDAGFVIRATQEEIGVDSYHGYFAGLRDLDDTLILGRADYGWHEFRAIPVHPGVYTDTWYHLKVIAYDCVIAASAVTPQGKTVVASVNDPNCIQEGRFGLQSYSTGAIWRHVRLRRAAKSDLEAMLSGQVPALPDDPPVTPGITDLEGYQRESAPMRRELLLHQTDLNAPPIASLKLLPPNHPTHVTVQGVVTLVSPTLFIQDSSGGITLPQSHTLKPVQIGDAVEATGDAEQVDFGSVLRNASVRLLWSHASLPPVSVSAAQAATGAYDAEFIETEGRLDSVQQSNGKSVRINLSEASQSFVAIADNPRPAEAMRDLEPGSILRLRGICVTNRAFTRNEIPFALILRSLDDTQVIDPPPWWNTQHIIELIAGVLILSFVLQLIYTSVKRSRLRAVLEERERLAHEMHDTLAQSFAGLGYQLEALCREVETDTPLREQLESTVSLVRFGHMEARRNIAALMPGHLEQLGLAKALEQAAHEIVKKGPIQVVTIVRGEVQQLPLRIADTLFRIGQEAVVNAVRHAQPQTIQLRFVYGRRSVKLTIRDDGKGFVPEGEGSGFGIRGMKRRADGINATFRVRSTLGHGTSVAVRAMLPNALLSSWWLQFASKDPWRHWLHGRTI